MEPELANDTSVLHEKKAICHTKVTLMVTLCSCIRQQKHMESKYRFDKHSVGRSASLGQKQKE